MRDNTAASLLKLKTAHRYFVTKLTQYRDRDVENWGTEEGGPRRPQNRYVNGRLRIPTFDTMRINQRIQFQERFKEYITSITAVMK